MAQRRMFSPEIVESEEFLSCPQTSQNLYFHLGMNADDDGFIQPKKTMREIGSNDDDLKVLLAKRFLLSFQSGVVVVKHWLIHNMIRSDRYKPTRFQEEKNTIFIKENKAYTDHPPIGCHSDNQMAPQVRLGKVRLGKDSIEIGEEKTLTPSEEAKIFFEKGNKYTELLEIFSKGRDQKIIEREFVKFCLYWTEPNKSGTKTRWQQQPTFEIKRRLLTWLNKSAEFSKNNNQQKYAPATA